jgi:hypothetical protein
MFAVAKLEVGHALLPTFSDAAGHQNRMMALVVLPLIVKP